MTPQEAQAQGLIQYGTYERYQDKPGASEAAHAKLFAKIPADVKGFRYMHIAPELNGPMPEDCDGIHAAKWYA